MTDREVMNDSSSSSAALAGVLAVGAAVFVIWLIAFGIGQLGARYTPQAGQIGVVREGSSFVWIGDWFNGHNIKKVVPPGADEPTNPTIEGG